MTFTGELNPVLKEFWEAPARNRVLYGGRASSKSHDAAGMAIFLASEYQVKFLCTRQFQNRIADSVYPLLKLKTQEFGLYDEFKFTESSIIHKGTGSEFIFYGIARNLDEIKGLENIDIAWHEESHLLTEEQWRTIDPTLRKEGSQHWLIFNPRFSSDFIYQRFVVAPPPNTVIKKINYTDNPFLSRTMLDVIESSRIENEEEYSHVYLGNPLCDDDRVIIKLSWIEAAIDADKKLGFAAEGEKIIGFDVADDGGDKNANVFAHGSVALWCEEWQGLEDELLKSCSRTYANAVRHEAKIRYDCIGVGAACGAKFDEINSAKSGRIKFEKFNAGDAIHDPDKYYDAAGRIKNKDHFSNLKSQTWWLVADRFRNTFDAVRNGTIYPADKLISISGMMPHLEKLKTELSTPRRDFDQNGRVKVESKKDLAKRGVKSPNCADAFIMCFAPTRKPMNISAEALQQISRCR